MKTAELLEQCDKLKQSHEWEHRVDSARYTATIGPYTLVCDKRERHAEYRVEHERFGVMAPWRAVENILTAKAEALDFVRASILGLHEPSHA